MSLSLDYLTFSNTGWFSSLSANLNYLNFPYIVAFDTFPNVSGNINQETRDLSGAVSTSTHLVTSSLEGTAGGTSGTTIFTNTSFNNNSYYIFGPIYMGVGGDTVVDLQANIYEAGANNITTANNTHITVGSAGIYVAYLIPPQPATINVSGLKTIGTINIYNSYPKNVNLSESNTSINGTYNGDSDTYTYDLSTVNKSIAYYYGPIYGDPNTAPVSLDKITDLSSVGSVAFNILTSEFQAFILFYFSPVCFLKGTPVETDQGEIEIDKLLPDVNTIKGKRIIKIVETHGTPTCLCLIKKDQLSPNVPNKDTVITKWHKVIYNGTLVKAMNLPGIHVCQYNGETLYNVLMDEHETMVVNGMTVETLDPNHEIAK
jgi:hypothetical protein